jgi:hypothetical protein
MTIGASVFLIALGAILAFAVGTTQVGTVQLDVVGFILMAAGLLGIVLELTIWNSAAPWTTRRRTRVVERDPGYVDREDIL